ncbi:MAG: alpha/beta hydrolase, partial [Vicinamibacteria bacterium]
MQQRRTFLAASAAAIGAAAAVHAGPARRTSRLTSGRLTLKDGTELFVKDWGTGRPVILTHAWPLSADCWDHQA